jgi:DNA-binding CsgD family transcriptional regulator
LIINHPSTPVLLSASREQNWAPAGESFDVALRSVTEILNMSAVGVALYDKGLRCRALNAALAKMTGIPATEQVGKTYRQVFGETAREVEAAFDGVCRAGCPLLNFEFAIQPAATMKRSRWFLNFHPIKGETGGILLVAAFFFEITKKSVLEKKVTLLVKRLMARGSSHPGIGGEDFVDLSTRSVEVIKRSLEVIKSSIALRCQLLETRIEAEFRRPRPLTGGRMVPRFGLPLDSPVFRRPVKHSHQCGEGAISNLPTRGPSPRERQVVGLLAAGKSNKEMAAILELSTRTVEAYRARVMAKLKLHSAAELVRYAVRNNLIQA